MGINNMEHDMNEQTFEEFLILLNQKENLSEEWKKVICEVVKEKELTNLKTLKQYIKGGNLGNAQTFESESEEL